MTTNKAVIQIVGEDKTGPAFARAQSSMRRLGSEAAAFASRFGGIGPAIGLAATAAAAATAALVKNAINAADAAAKQAQATGLAVEQYTALAYAAKLSGVEATALGTSLTLLNKDIVEGSTALQSLGINTRSAAGALKDGDQVLAEIADRFAAMPDGAQKSALALKLLGENGVKLIPLLNQGSAGLANLKDEAKRFGVVISGETARAAEELNDNLTRTKAAVDGLALELAKEMLPTLNELSTRALKNAKDFGVLRGSIMALFEVMLGGTEPADLLEKQSAATRESIKGLRMEIETLTKRGVGEGFQGGVLGQLRTELATLEREASGSTQRLTDALNEAAGRTRFGRGVGFRDPRIITPDIKSGGKETGKAAAPKVSEAQRYADMLQRQLDATQDLTVTEQLLLDIQRGRLGAVSQAQEANLRGLAEQIDAEARMARTVAETAKAREGAAAIDAKHAEAMAQDVAQLAEGNQALREEIALIGAGAEARAAIEQARLNSAIALKEEALAMAQNAQATQGEIQALEQQIALLRERKDLTGQRGMQQQLADDAAEAQKFADSLGHSFSSAFEDAVVNGRKLSDVLNGLAQDITRMILKKQVTDPLAKAIGGFDFGGFIGGLFGGGRAGGGPVSAGRIYEVNEQGGPGELLNAGGRQYLLATQSGNVTPTASAQQQRSVSYSPTFVLQQPASRETQQQLAATAYAGAQRAFARNG